MKKTNLLTIALVMLVALTAPMITRADVQDRLFDFTDDYYRQNGVDPGASPIIAPNRNSQDGKLNYTWRSSKRPTDR
jgi:hypothetical protein